MQLSPIKYIHVTNQNPQKIHNITQLLPSPNSDSLCMDSTPKSTKDSRSQDLYEEVLKWLEEQGVRAGRPEEVLARG